MRVVGLVRGARCWVLGVGLGDDVSVVVERRGGVDGTDLIWVIDSGWASPSRATLAVKKAFGLPATMVLLCG
jgi:hypothetical protein